MTPPDARSPRFPLEAADRCVMCGLCLPHCPTYRLTLNEAESPRGRIALMAAEARGTLPAGAAQAHLDRCLGCRACERACPSKVPYSQLIDSHQSVRRAAIPALRSIIARIARNRVLARPSMTRLATRSLRLTQRLRLTRLAPLLGLRRAAELLPPLPAAVTRHSQYPAVSGERGQVALFTGCIGDLIDGGNTAAIALLTRFGYRVHVPPAQRCCGALHLHAGDPEQARRLALANVDAFRSIPADAILGTASACTLMLSEYGSLIPAGDGIGSRVQEVGHFLARQPWPAELKPAVLNASVAVHHPCTQVQGLNSHRSTIELLDHIPGISLKPLPTQSRCCGGGGDYMLRQPRIADILANETLEQLVNDGTRLLVSSNIGCIIHLQAAARRLGMDLEILHPLSLLDRQLNAATVDTAAIAPKRARD